MSTSTHETALFEEGFALVRVEESDVHAYGVETLYDLIQEHPWVLEQELPILIVYPTSQGMQAHGDEELAAVVMDIAFEDIVWGHELTLEWEDEDDEE